MRYDLWKQLYFLEKTVFQLIQSDPFIPWPEVTTNLWKGHYHHPKKVTKICWVLVCFWILVTRVFGCLSLSLLGSKHWLGLTTVLQHDDTPWSRVPFSPKRKRHTQRLGGGFIFFIFTPNLGEMIQFDSTNIFQRGWNHQLDKDVQSFVFPRSD